jgi:hypothetical protein
MGKKNFLPISQRDVELPLMGNVPEGTGVYRDTVTQNRRGLPKAVKTKSWVMKMFSALTFLGLIFGGTIIGFSFKMIGDNQVGYYDGESGYMEPGIYFQFPWTKEEMHIVNIGREFLHLENIIGVFNNGSENEFHIAKADVSYNIHDIDKYINVIQDMDPVYCHTEIEKAIIEDISNSDIQSLFEVYNISVNECGINIRRAVISKPIFTQHIPVVINMKSDDMKLDDYDSESSSTIIDEIMNTNFTL